MRKILGAVDNTRSQNLLFVDTRRKLTIQPQFIQANLQSLRKIVTASAGITVIVGFVDSDGDIYDAATVISNGKLIGAYHKIYLHNYGVFDENRYFRAGNECPVYGINSVNIDINVCEGIWYETGPATVQTNAGDEVIINIRASPFHSGKGVSREKMIASRASDNIAIYAYNNLVGGQDELVFDGHSLIFDEAGV